MADFQFTMTSIERQWSRAGSLKDIPPDLARMFADELDEMVSHYESLMEHRQKGLAQTSDACVLPLTHNGPCETARSKDGDARREFAKSVMQNIEALQREPELCCVYHGRPDCPECVKPEEEKNGT